MQRRCHSIAGAGGPQSGGGVSALERVGCSAANEEVFISKLLFTQPVGSHPVPVQVMQGKERQD